MWLNFQDAMSHGRLQKCKKFMAHPVLIKYKVKFTNQDNILKLFFRHLPVCMKLPTGECPGKFACAGPGEELLNNPPGLGTCGLRGEFATSPDDGLGCGIIGIGLGLMLGGSDVGEARLNEVEGLEPNPVWVPGWLMFEVWGLAGVCGFEPDGGVKGGWKRRPGSRCWAGDCGPRWCPKENMQKKFL